MKQIMKLMTAISLLLCLCTPGYLGNACKVSAKTKTAHMYQVKKQQLDPFQNIAAELGDMDLKIKPSKDGKFYLSYKLYCNNSKNPLICQVKDNTLHINSTRLDPALYRYKKGSFAVYHAYTSLMRATLFVPSGKLADIILNGRHPDISIRKISCKNVSIKVTHGDVAISGVNSGKLQVQADAGDISFSDTGISSLLQIKTNTGDITGSGLDVSGTAEFETNCGDIRLPDLSVSGQMQINAKNGDITAAGLDVSGTAGFTTDYGDIRLPDLSVSGQMQIDTKYGNVGLKINKKCMDRLGVTMKTAEGNMSVQRSLGGKKKRYMEDGWRYVKNAPDNGGRLVISTRMGDLSLKAVS